MTLNVIKDEKNGLNQWHVVLDSKLWHKQLAKTEKELLSQVEVPGFRKGKVPEKIAKKHLTSEQILKAAGKKAVSSAYEFALGQNPEVKPTQEPEIKIEKLTTDECEVTFSFDLPLAITISNYRNISIPKPVAKVSDKEVTEQIKLLQDRFAVFNVKTEGALAKSDLAVFDFVGHLDGQPFPGGEGKNMELEIGSGKFIPGFEDGMLGMNAGDKKTIEVTFPQNYHVPTLKGKLVTFDITLHEIKIKNVNEDLNELVKDANIPDVTTVEQLKAHIKQQILLQKTMSIKENFMEELVSEIVKNSQIVIPNFAIKAEIKRLEQDFSDQLAKQNVTLENYLAITGLKDEDIKENIKLDAIKQLQSFLVIEEIIKQEKITITDEEIEQQLQRFAEQFKLTIAEVKQNIKDLSIVATTLKRNKAFDLLWENNGQTGEAAV